MKNKRPVMPAWVLSGVVLAAILWLTLAPHPIGQVHVELFPGADKLVHGLMMAALTASLLTDATIARGRRPKPKAAIIIFVAVVIFSVMDEWAQGAMDLGRSTDPCDLVADIAGSLVVTMTYFAINAFRAR